MILYLKIENLESEIGSIFYHVGEAASTSSCKYKTKTKLNHKIKTNDAEVSTYQGFIKRKQQSACVSAPSVTRSRINTSSQ